MEVKREKLRALFSLDLAALYQLQDAQSFFG